MSELTNKVILITGATSGIGRATALHFSVLGAKFVAASRTPSAGVKLIAELTSEGAQARFIATDITKKEQVRKLVDIEHLAKTVAFLCSPAAQMIKGHDIPLDGGQLAKL